MDLLTFISEIAWPFVAAVALICFRKPLVDILPSIIKIKLGNFEIEREAPGNLSNNDTIKLEDILKIHGTHSFKWLRKIGGLALSDEQFGNIISENSDKFLKTNIQLIDQNGDIIESRNGVKLAKF